MAVPSSAPKTPPDSIYPEVTRHLPGNASPAKLPSLTGVQPEILAATGKRVHKRVQSLHFYAMFTLCYGICSVLVYTVGRQSLNEGAFLVSIPELLQRVGLVAAVLPVLCASVFISSKSLQTVKLALVLQLVAYIGVFLTAFGLIVTDFTNFFFGVGLVAVVQVFLGLWTRSVLSDVHELRDSLA